MGRLDKQRSQRLSILQGILLTNIILCIVVVLVNMFVNTSQSFLTEFVPSLVLIVFLILYKLAKEGFLELTSLTLIGIISLLAYYLEFNFGTVIPHSWILMALSIVIGGVILTSSFVLFLLITHTIILILLTCLQNLNFIKYQQWDIKPTLGSILVTVVILGIISLISWLSNKEIEKALKRAIKLESDLKSERDNLEIEVEKRTKELQKVQLEKVSNLYKFADFGRLVAGLFHDIANPLTQVSLSLSNIEYQSKNKLSAELKIIDPVVKRAINGTKQMEKLMESMKKQIQQQENTSLYNPWEEIGIVMENLEYKAKKIEVEMELNRNKEISVYGNSLKFYQVVSNLVSNALDSYQDVERKENRKIIIKLNIKNNELILTVQDFGCGIDEKIREKIFDSWFTTKGNTRGLGIGLYISKNIVEKDLAGKIEVESKINQGSIFTIRFPVKISNDEK